jgi:amino acid adenylation domain-containing protein
VRPGTNVGVALERSLEVAVALLGILKAGAAYVPLDLSYPRERLEFMCADAELRFAVADGETAARALPAQVACIDPQRDAAAIGAHSGKAPQVISGPDAVAYITYTSGSTGRPKGVAVPHRGVTRLVRGADYVDIARNDVFLHFAPLAFDASTFEVWGALLNGARLAIPEPGPLSMAELGRSVQRLGVTTLWLTAPLFRLMVETELPSFRGLRALLTGGDVVSPEHARRFLEAYPRCNLVNGYGPTENTTFSCCYRVPSAESIRSGVPIGRPIANSSAHVLDRDLQPVATGVPGELCVGGDGVALGYLNLPELTAERFIPDPFSSDPDARLYRTGDLARFRPDGVLDFLGRLDHQVKIRGYRIELGEIEAALLRQPGVRAAAVVAAEREGDKLLFAYAVAAPDVCLDAFALRRALSETLPSYMLPHHIEILERLPAHASGKIDRVALARKAAVPEPPAAVAAPAPAASAPQPARLTTQERVRGIWREALVAGMNPGLDENFFDAGGDSLSLLSVHEKLQRSFGIALGVTELFTHTTIRKQTALVDRLRR